MHDDRIQELDSVVIALGAGYASALLALIGLLLF